MQSNLNCASATPVLSNTFTAVITTGLPLILANDTTVCEGSNLQLNAPLGYTYNWFPNMGLNNAGIANPIATINNNITYHLTIIDASGCAGVDSITINSNPLPIFNLGNNQAACVNSEVQLNGPTGYTYIWQPTSGLDNATIANPVATISADIEYVLSITDAIGCVANDSIFITANALPMISLGGDSTICENNCLTLLPNVIGNIQSIVWGPAATLNSIAILNPVACPITNTSYTVTITDTNQCSASNSINVIVDPTPAIPQISFDGFTLTSTVASTYEWYFNGAIIAGANSINYVPTTNGDYTVEVSNGAGCNAISAALNVNINAVFNIYNSDNIVISPNPVFDVLQLSLSKKEQIDYLSIYNSAGVKVYEQNAISSNKVAVDIKLFSAGTYIVSVQTALGVYNRRFTVVK